MSSSSASGPAESRKRGRQSRKGVADLAGDVLDDIVALFRTEIELLRVETSEKIRAAALSAAFIGAGAVLLAATIVLVLQAAIAFLVQLGLSYLAAILVVAAITLIAGLAVLWFGMRGLATPRLMPMKTLDQIRKDVTIANAEG
jgi:uncharacterized membrane protein YqjE